MLRVKDRHQPSLFDPWTFLSPKRRQMLDDDWPGLFRTHILDILPVEQLAALFPRKTGRPTKELTSVLGALILQQYHDLDDLETCRQFSYNLQWHYALDIYEESDQAKYICPKTLWSMRTLATELGLAGEAFDAAVQKLALLFEVDTRRQRLDSVHIRSNMARLGRLGIFVKGIVRFLTNLKRHHRALWEQVDAALIDRYQGEKAKQCFAGVKPSASKRVLSDVASDLYGLVRQFDGSSDVADMTSYQTLCRIVAEQCDVSPDGTVEVKAASQISSTSLQNPSDPDATYSGHKGQGYQVQVMETYTEHEEPKKAATQLNLITHVAVEEASKSDAQALLPALEAVVEKDLAPEAVTVDTLYTSDENCRQAEELGVEVIGPVMGTEKCDSAALSDFIFSADGHVKTCPQGHAPCGRKKKKDRFTQAFPLAVCEACPLVESCKARRGAKFFFVRYTEKAMRNAKRRQYEATDAFAEKYRWRAGIEATMSQYDRLTGVKRLRVRGMKAVRFAAVFKALAVNIARAVAVQKARKRANGPDCPGNGAPDHGYALFKELLSTLMQWLTRWVDPDPKLRTFAHQNA